MASPNKLILLTALADLKDLVLELRSRGYDTLPWQSEVRRLTRRLIDLEGREDSEPGNS